MMMKGSSSTFLYALLGVTVILCIVKEGHGLKCYDISGDPFECIPTTPCSSDKHKACATGSLPNGGAIFEKGCICATGKDDCLELTSKKRCWCSKDLCNNEGVKGGATTITQAMALSTLFLASTSTLVIITSSCWTL